MAVAVLYCIYGKSLAFRGSTLGAVARSLVVPEISLSGTGFTYYGRSYVSVISKA